MSRLCVYTAIAGGYEQLKPHPYVKDVDWIAFTDDPEPGPAARAGWSHRRMQPGDGHPRMRAKFYKVNSTSVLHDYDRTLWVDASVELTDGDWVAKQLHDHRGWTVLAHPERNCIYAEAVASLDMPKYADQDLLSQVAWYRMQGHPTRWGLWCGGIIARSPSPFVTSIERAWWHEIERWSYQDQLSLPYVFRNHQLHPGEIAGNLYDHPNFRVHFQPTAR
jgi:Protein of unknown function (DUF616)